MSRRGPGARYLRTVSGVSLDGRVFAEDFQKINFLCRVATSERGTMSSRYDAVDLHEATAVSGRRLGIRQLLYRRPVPQEEREDQQEEEFD